MRERDMVWLNVRIRKVFGFFLAGIGLCLAAASVAVAIFPHVIPLSSVTLAVLAIVVLLAGVIILITEAIESWLSRGQAALVDGLQAG